MANESLSRIIVRNCHSKRWKDDMICTQQKHDWKVSLAHWKDIKLTQKVGKENRIRYGIRILQNMSTYSVMLP